MNSNIKNTLIILVIIFGIFMLGYYLSKNPAQAQKTTTDNSMAGHHVGGTAVSINSEQLNSLVGKQLPDIQLSDKNGNVVNSASLKGKVVVLFFNEGLMCYPACWNQVASFGSDSRFNNDEIQAYSVLVDSAKDWQRAIDKMPELAEAGTLFDVGASASKSLGLLTLPSSMHRGSLPGHTYIVVDKDGIVRFVKDDPYMAIANDLLINEIAKFN